MSGYSEISKSTLQRLPIYLVHLKSLRKAGIVNTSAPMIASALKFGEVQVRKDLACVSNGGRPKLGYVVDDLITELEHFLGCGGIHNAVVIGAGKLGQAIMDYRGFEEFGLNIVGGFDLEESQEGITDGDKPIFHLSKFGEFVERMQIRLGIITVPEEVAQQTCDLMISHGIVGILNFAPIHLTVPGHITIQNVNIAASLAVLSNRLTEPDHNHKERKL